MLLSEALLLLILDEDKGTANWVHAVDAGLAGALLLDLAGLKERPSEPALAAAWDVVTAEDKPPRHWVSKLPGRLKPIKGTVASGLVARGVLEEKRHKTLGLFSSTRYPERDPQPERELRERLRAVLADGAEPSAFDASLLGLLVPLDLVKRIAGGKDAKARAKEIAERGPVGDAVKRAVQQEINAAVIAATVAATSAATTST